MVYKGKMKISQEEINYYNELLQLDLEKCSPYYNEHDIERLGAKQNDFIGVRTIDFDNGNYVTIDLASGDSNYFDNIVLWNKDNQELLCSFCTFELLCKSYNFRSNFSLCYNNDIYDIEMVVI